MDMTARRVGVGWSGRRLLNPSLSSARSSAQIGAQRSAPAAAAHPARGCPLPSGLCALTLALHPRPDPDPHLPLTRRRATRTRRL